MKRKSGMILSSVIVTILLFNSTLMGQTILRSSGIVLRGSFWDTGDDQSLVSVSSSGGVRVGQMGGWISFFSRKSDNMFIELNIGGILKRVEVGSGFDDAVEIMTICPIVMGLRYNLLPVRNPSAIQPYVALSGGPYWHMDVRVGDHWGPDEDVIVESQLLPGINAGGGFNFHLASWFAFNFDVRYHFINFNFGHDSGGLEIGMGVAFSWGRFEG